MSIETKSITLQRKHESALFELLITLDHNLIDLKFATEKSWDTKDYTLVREQIFSLQDTLSDACQLFLQEAPQPHPLSEK